MKRTSVDIFMTTLFVFLNALAFGWWQRSVPAGLFMFTLPTVVCYIAIALIEWAQ